MAKIITCNANGIRAAARKGLFDWLARERADVVCIQETSEADQYTWWSHRGQAWARNVGWRLDYQVITPKLADKVRAASIYKEERFSDHAPQIMEYELKITR